MSQYTILIACFNEQDTIGKVLDEIQQNYPDIPILVVDNASTDNSKQEIIKYQNVTYLFESKPGKSNAVKTAYPYIKTPAIILIDADSEYHVTSIEYLIDAFNSKTAMVIGSRNKSVMLIRSKIANFIVQKLLYLRYQCHIPDCLSGARIIKTDLLDQISSHGFELETELNVICLKNKHNIATTPIQYTPRLIGKKIKARDMIKLVKVALR